MNRVGAGRLLDIGTILQVPVTYFYEGLSTDRFKVSSEDKGGSLLLATTEGQRLIKAFSMIESPQLRRKLVDLIEIMSNPQCPASGPELANSGFAVRWRAVDLERGFTFCPTAIQIQ